MVAMTPEAIITQTMNNPTVLILGLAVGYIVRWIQGKRSSGMGGMGGSF
jgi:hypothetical protein